MNNQKLTLIVKSAIAIASITACVCSVSISACNNKDAEIERINNVIEQLEEENNKANTELNNKSKQIDELNIELQEKNSELEFARQEIKDLETRVSYNPYDVTDISNTTAIHMQRALNGTALYDYAEVFTTIEDEYGINAYFVAAIAALESSWGTSDRAVNDNNLTGRGVYTKLSRGINAPTKEQNLLRTAEDLKENYLTPGGNYFKGYSSKEINQSYCLEWDSSDVNYNWYKQVNQIANELIEKANNF